MNGRKTFNVHTYSNLPVCFTFSQSCSFRVRLCDLCETFSFCCASRLIAHSHTRIYKSTRFCKIFHVTFCNGIHRSAWNIWGESGRGACKQTQSHTGLHKKVKTDFIHFHTLRRLHYCRKLPVSIDRLRTYKTKLYAALEMLGRRSLYAYGTRFLSFQLRRSFQRALFKYCHLIMTGNGRNWTFLTSKLIHSWMWSRGSVRIHNNTRVT